MNKIVDAVLIVVLILAAAGVAYKYNSEQKRQCQAKGGKWTYMTKTYYRCEMPKKAV